MNARLRRLLKLAILGWVPLALALPLPAQTEGEFDSQRRTPSVTVFPVDTKPNRFPADFAKRVGTVVATLLEKAGVEDLEVVDTVFDPPDTDEVNSIAHAFGKLVVETSINTDYAVFTQFLGTPQQGVAEIRTIVVHKSGRVILAESADEAELDKAVPRPKDPMTSCVFVSRRLQV